MDPARLHSQWEREPYIERRESLTFRNVGFGIGRLLCYSVSSGPKCIDPEEDKVLSLRRTNRVFSMSRSSSHEFGMGFRTAHMTPGPD